MSPQLDLQPKLENCTVIEGSLIIAMGTMDYENNDYGFRPDFNISFPHLREVTDYVMLYQTKYITGLATLFPNLAVIRGNNLFKVCVCVSQTTPHFRSTHERCLQ